MWKSVVFRPPFPAHQSPSMRWCWAPIWICPASPSAPPCRMSSGWRVRSLPRTSSVIYNYSRIIVSGSEDLTPENEMPIGRNVLQLINIQESANYTCIAASTLGQIDFVSVVKVQCKYTYYKPLRQCVNWYILLLQLCPPHPPMCKYPRWPPLRCVWSGRTRVPRTCSTMWSSTSRRTPTRPSARLAESSPCTMWSGHWVPTRSTSSTW